MDTQQPAKCQKCDKRRKLSEYIDLLTGASRWFCWNCACGK